MTATASPRRLSRVVRIVLEVVIFIAVLASVRAYQHRDVPGDAAPALSGMTVQGAAFDLADTGSRPILVHFWATWCSVCRFEQDSIAALSRDFPVISIAMQSGTEDDVRRHLAENQLPFAAINDPDGAIAARWGVHAVPASFVIDEKGNVRFVEIGYTTEAGLRARMKLAHS